MGETTEVQVNEEPGLVPGDVQEAMEREVAESPGAAEPSEPSMSFLVGIGDAPVPALRLEHWGGDPSWYVLAKHPHGDEKKITKAAGDVRRIEGGEDRGDETELKLNLDARDYFIAKCLHQVVGFRLPFRNRETGQEGVREFEPKGMPKGNNRSNTEIYEAIADDRDKGFYTLLNEYLDWVAARPHKAQTDFEALGNAQGQ